MVFVMASTLALAINLGQHIYFTNHKSSSLDPSFISSYIISEQAAGHYSVDFQPAKLEVLIGPFHTSPLGLVPNPSSSSFRLIQDLSFPRNHTDLFLVNARICSDEFPTEWGSFEATTNLILSLPPRCVTMTFNISAAYRLTQICPDQQNVLCVYWDRLVYVDRAVMFGLSSSAGVFSCVADMLLDIYRAVGFGFVIKWVDNFFTIRPPGQIWSEQEFIKLTGAVGIPWSLSKLWCFSSI